MFEKARTPELRGKIGEAAAVFFFSAEGYIVSIPLSENQKYDLICDRGLGLKRIQVKTTMQKKKSGDYIVNLKTNSANSKGNSHTNFDPNDVDYLFVLCGDGRMFCIPAKEIKAVSKMTIGKEQEKYMIAKVSGGGK